MRRRGLLIAGITLVSMSIVGSAVQAGVSGQGYQGWFGHMFDGGDHMWGWSGSDAPRQSGPPVADAEEATVVATDFAFAPETVVVAGEAVNIRLDNQGSAPHDLVVPELGLRVSASPGREAVAGIVDPEPGTYDMWCTYPGHADAGMTGTFIVEPTT
jgi:heme/copper-type cytochrome/quinol oxidase subunit 2